MSSVRHITIIVPDPVAGFLKVVAWAGNCLRLVIYLSPSLALATYAHRLANTQHSVVPTLLKRPGFHSIRLQSSTPQRHDLPMCPMPKSAKCLSQKRSMQDWKMVQCDAQMCIALNKIQCKHKYSTSHGPSAGALICIRSKLAGKYVMTLFHSSSFETQEKHQLILQYISEPTDGNTGQACMVQHLVQARSLSFSSCA
jgi:hypothetical protein